MWERSVCPPNLSPEFLQISILCGWRIEGSALKGILEMNYRIAPPPW